MKNFIYAFALLVVAATGFVACDKSSDEVVLSDRCCITSFKVTALKREVHTTSTTTGADSVYYTTTNASTMRMLIDQRAGTITNLDLLPKTLQSMTRPRGQRIPLQAKIALISLRLSSSA